MLPLIDMEINDVPDNPQKSKEINTFEIKSSVKNILVSGKSESDKKEWMELLHEYISTLQKKAKTLRSKPQPHPLTEKQKNLTSALDDEGILSS